METLKADVLAVALRPWPTIVRSQGSLHADEQTVVGAKVAGRVDRVHFEVGDFVKAGDPLVTLDQEEFRLQVDQAEAQYQQSRSAVSLQDDEPVEKLDLEVLGGGHELERTLSDFGWTFLMSFVFVYIVLAAQYENLIYPLIILLSLPLAIPFGLLSLYWGGETLNLYSALGILVLFGVVKKAAILQVDHTNALRRQGWPRHEAGMQANRDRLRLILMTTTSFVAGLLPLLIATGPGAEERRTIAVLAAGGQALSLVLTLLAIPVLYTFFDDLGTLPARLSVRRRRQPATLAPNVPPVVPDSPNPEPAGAAGE